MGLGADVLSVATTDETDQAHAAVSVVTSPLSWWDAIFTHEIGILLLFEAVLSWHLCGKGVWFDLLVWLLLDLFLLSLFLELFCRYFAFVCIFNNVFGEVVIDLSRWNLHSLSTSADVGPAFADRHSSYQRICLFVHSAAELVAQKELYDNHAGGNTNYDHYNN